MLVMLGPESLAFFNRNDWLLCEGLGGVFCLEYSVTMGRYTVSLSPQRLYLNNLNASASDILRMRRNENELAWTNGVLTSFSKIAALIGKRPAKSSC